MKKKAFGAKRIFLFLTIITCLGFANEALGSGQVVRVGCVDIENFINVDAKGNANGYGADYLKRIAVYTGWSYEYRRGAWSDCMRWLDSGEIDLLMPAEYSEERAEHYLFSDMECCLDYAALIGKKSDDNFYYEDYEAYDGMAVGMIKENYLNLLFEAYASDHDFSYRSVYYETGAALAAALENGEVDAIVNGNMEYTRNQKLLAKIDFMPAYFITGKDNAKLMGELNAALNQIFLNNPYYTAELHSKYYDSIERQSIGFTRQEANFIRQAGQVNILMEEDNSPMEWYDAKAQTFYGVYIDILRLVEKESGLKFNFVVNNSPGSNANFIKQGKADVWGSASDSEEDLALNTIFATNSYYECSYRLVGRKETNLELSKALTIAALKKETEIHNRLNKQYPAWNIVTYENVEDCLKSVARSEADLAAVSFWRLSAREPLSNQDLAVIDAEAMSFPIRMGVSGSADPMLASVLNKAILKIDKHKLEESIFNGILSAKEKVTLGYLLKKHPIYGLTAGALLTLILMAGIFVITHNQLLKDKNRELSEAVATQEQLRKEAQTDVLTGLKNKNTAEFACQTYLEQHREEMHAILILDLDNFKEINDTYGHLCGDGVLKWFGWVLLSSSEPEDIVGRIGGDEFLMFLSHVQSRQQVIDRVEAIYQRVAQKTEELSELSISCSMGIIMTNEEKQEFDDLYFQADQALYEAKAQGKGRYVMEFNA